jgi:hypothetical protein
VAITHRPSSKDTTDGVTGRGVAGFPEQNAPEQGIGRGRAGSSGSVERLRSSMWAVSPVDCDRLVT